MTDDPFGDVIMTPSGPVSKGELAEMDYFDREPGGDPSSTTEIRLPRSPRVPVRRTIQSADPDLRICVHELARALEQYARKQYVPLYAGTAEFETAAIDMSEFILAERCQLKGH